MMPLHTDTSGDGAEGDGNFAMALQAYLMYIPTAPASGSSQSTTASSRSTSQASSDGPSGARIALVVNGSRGDIEPMTALARSLKGYGHTVRLLTNANFKHFCLQRGIDTVPTFADTEWVLRKLGGLGGVGKEAIEVGAREAMEVGQSWSAENPGVLKTPEDALKEFRPHIMICGCQAMRSCLTYERDEEVPTIIVHSSRASLELYSGLNALQPPRPAFFIVSEHFDNRPVADEITKTAPWILEDYPIQSDFAHGGKLRELHGFVKKHDAPIVAVSWGSMFPRGMLPLEMLWLVLTALSVTKRRGVILGGWARLDELGRQLIDGELVGLGNKWQGLAKFAAKQVHFIHSASHKWLLPRCSCVIHHGGIGTAHAALRAGTPAVVTPIFADEFETSERVRVLGAGVGFEEALPDITPEKLAQAITRAERMADNVKVVRMAMRREDGTDHAATEVNEFLQQKVLNNKWQLDFLDMKYDKWG